MNARDHLISWARRVLRGADAAVLRLAPTSPVTWDIRLQAVAWLFTLVPALSAEPDNPDWARRVGQVVTIDGIRLRIAPSLSPQMVSRIVAGDHTRSERFVTLAALRPGDVVMELGAGIGMVSIACAQRVGAEHVFAYEANADLEPLARENFELNGLSPTLTIAMLGPEAGEAPFHICRDFGRSSVYSPPNPQRTVTSRVLAFDAEAAATGANFLVADIEGAEADLLPRVDLRPFRALAIEVHPKVIGGRRTNGLRRLLRQRGFREALVRDGVVFLYLR